LDLDPFAIFPADSVEISMLASHLGISPLECQERINALSGTHPDLGLRGCRFSIMQPKLVDIQIRAILCKYLFAFSMIGAIN
jgi:phosphoenolpyruvate synthase/pyruvate phosphate dikinase